MKCARGFVMLSLSLVVAILEIIGDARDPWRTFCGDVSMWPGGSYSCKRTRELE